MSGAAFITACCHNWIQRPVKTRNPTCITGNILTSTKEGGLDRPLHDCPRNHECPGHKMQDIPMQRADFTAKHGSKNSPSSQCTLCVLHTSKLIAEKNTSTVGGNRNSLDWIVELMPGNKDLGLGARLYPLYQQPLLELIIEIFNMPKPDEMSVQIQKQSDKWAITGSI